MHNWFSISGNNSDSNETKTKSYKKQLGRTYIRVHRFGLSLQVQRRRLDMKSANDRFGNVQDNYARKCFPNYSVLIPTDDELVRIQSRVFLSSDNGIGAACYCRPDYGCESFEHK